MSCQNSGKIFTEFQEQCYSWLHSEGKEPTRKINYNLENRDIKIIFLRRRMDYSTDDMINNTINISTQAANIQNLFKTYLTQPDLSDTHGRKPANWDKSKLYVFPYEYSIHNPTLQFELRFFENETSMDSQVNIEVEKYNSSKPPEVKKQPNIEKISKKSPSGCILQ